MRDDERGLSRRELVKRGATGAAGAAVAGGMASPAQAARKRPRPRPITSAEAARGYLIGLTSLAEEISIDRLPVEGKIPAWLSGTLVRNGPAQWEVGKRTFGHWFDGLAMLHAFRFRGGRVGYANRFLRCSQYESARKDGKIAFNEFGTDPCREIFSGVISQYHFAPVPNANVTVKQLGDKFVANTEYPMPVMFDPRTLETLGVHRPSETDAQIATAHPHRDPRTGEVLDYAIRVFPNTAYIIRSFANGRWRTLAEIPTSKLAYLHSFALTERYVVITEGPLLVEPQELALDKRPFIENYVWDGGRGTRFYVVERTSGRHVATMDAESFFCFHHINAYEEGNRIVVDLIAHKDSEIIDALYLAKLRGELNRAYGSDFYVRRCTLDMNAKTASVRKLGPGIELPRIDYDRFNTRPYRFAYGVAVRDPRRSGFSDQIGKLDTSTGKLKTWQSPECYPGEPIFVRSPRMSREDGGVLLSVVLDARERTSFLLVLDARTLREIGRARVPHHIPFGFHGEHFNV